MVLNALLLRAAWLECVQDGDHAIDDVSVRLGLAHTLSAEREVELLSDLQREAEGRLG